ncbi:MAG: hypothetical protein NVS1B11_28670 [Terriglobales bacterium]
MPRTTFNNQPFAIIGSQATELFTETVGAFLTEEHVHMIPNCIIVQPHVYSVVVEEKYTVATPSL